jgi:hypothetical protein
MVSPTKANVWFLRGRKGLTVFLEKTNSIWKIRQVLDRAVYGESEVITEGEARRLPLT